MTKARWGFLQERLLNDRSRLVEKDLRESSGLPIRYSPQIPHDAHPNSTPSR